MRMLTRKFVVFRKGVFGISGQDVRKPIDTESSKRRSDLVKAHIGSISLGRINQYILIVRKFIKLGAPFVWLSKLDKRERVVVFKGGVGGDGFLMDHAITGDGANRRILVKMIEGMKDAIQKKMTIEIKIHDTHVSKSREAFIILDVIHIDIAYMSQFLDSFDKGHFLLEKSFMALDLTGRGIGGNTLVA